MRLRAFILAGCLACAGLILIAFGSSSSHRPSPAGRPPPAEIKPTAPEIRKLADQPFRPTERRPETAPLANDAQSQLRDVRLTGVVIGGDSRIAVFAVTGTSSRVLSEGEALNGWRIDSISPQRVVLSSSAGNVVLEPQPDAKLVRAPPPITIQPGQPAAAMADAPGQPTVVVPISVGNLSPATPGQAQDYPYYVPEYNPGNNPYPWDWSWGTPWGWGWPVGVAVGGCWNCGFRGGFFRPGVRRFGFGYPGFFHPGFGRLGFAHASFGGGSRGSGRR
jgi:hypothetical protein